jgi:hypothetical protein
MMRIVTIPGSWYGREAVFLVDDMAASIFIQAVRPERYTGCQKFGEGMLMDESGRHGKEKHS